MTEFLSLLSSRPNDVDFSLFTDSREKRFLKDYYTRYGELPEERLFRQEMQVPDEVQADAPWSYYEKKLKEEKFIREALPALTRFNNEYDRDQKEALLHLRERLVSLTEPTEQASPVSVVRDLSRYEYFKSNDNSRILTGIKPLDDVSGGLSTKDEFMIISARLGIGKSWVAHSIATSMALSGKRVGIYSGEMSEEEVGARFDSLVSHLSNFSLTRGKDVDLTEHKQKLSQINGDLLVLTSKHLRHNATPNDLRRFAKDCQLECLFVDQLSLMEPDGMRGGEAHERREALSFQLKSLQQELGIPLVAVSQLNRGAAQQEADESHLSGSDRFGQDATLIIALSRKDDTLKMKVLKARSFRKPDQPWEFTWDIDRGILEPKISAMDAVRAQVERARLRQADQQAQQSQPSQVDEGDDEIW